MRNITAPLGGVRSPFGQRRRGVPVDEDAAIYITAVEAADGEPLEADVKTAIIDFVVGCKADGIWDALKASCILAGARTLNGCLVPLVGTAPTNFNFVSGDYDRKTGLKGDGSTKYLDSNRNNNADPQDSQHLAAYVTEQIDPDAGRNDGYLGTITNTTGGSILGRSGSAARRLYAQSRHGVNYKISTATAVTGFHGKSRSLAASFDARLLGGTATQDSTSETPLDELVAVFNWGAAGSAHSINRLSFYSIGESIDLAALDTRTSDLMTAIDGAIA